MLNPNTAKEQMEKEPGRYSKQMTAPMVEPEVFEEEEEMVYEPQQSADEEVLPGLFQSDIDSWKKQFQNIYHVNVKGTDFIYRALGRFEYKQIISMPNTDPLMREEMICEYCVLYPLNYDFAAMADGLAGHPALLSESIMDTSGFTRDVKVTKL